MQDNTNREIEEFIEEHSGEDGYFADFEKVNKASIAAQIKKLKTGNIAEKSLIGRRLDALSGAAIKLAKNHRINCQQRSFCRVK
jgi:hypothetical protein